MKLTKRDAARQKRLVEALRKGKALGGILAGLAALAPVAGCEKENRVSLGIAEAISAEANPKASPPKPATTNATSEVKPLDRPPLPGRIAPSGNRAREVIEAPVRVMGLKAAPTNRVREAKSPNRRPLMGKIVAPPKSSAVSAEKK